MGGFLGGVYRGASPPSSEPRDEHGSCADAFSNVATPASFHPKLGFDAPRAEATRIARLREKIWRLERPHGASPK